MLVIASLGGASVRGIDASPGAFPGFGRHLSPNSARAYLHLTTEPFRAAIETATAIPTSFF
jgi:hypothetical protein